MGPHDRFAGGLLNRINATPKRLRSLVAQLAATKRSAHGHNAANCREQAAACKICKTPQARP
jgi:hypothetical protein